MSREEAPSGRRRQSAAIHRRPALWPYGALVLLGGWLLAGPATFGYHTATVTPAGPQVWLALHTRATLLAWNDLICGLLLAVCGWRALASRRPFGLWAACGVGVWLNVAPLLFWAPSAAAYLNDTVVGTLAIACSVVIPGLPNRVRHGRAGSAVPPGWSFNPSAWPKRVLTMGLAFAGWMVARYLAGFELGFIREVWDPFFGDGSRQVLTSFISEASPVADGGMGALIYTLNFLLLAMGGTDRWQSAPWVVATLGLLMVPLGVTHLTLIGLQATVVGHWCTLCLSMAAIALVLIALETAEVLATLQLLRRQLRRGASLRRVLWQGAPEGTPATGADAPGFGDLPERPEKALAAMTHGFSPSWSLLLSIGLGIWLISSPAVLESRAPAATMEHVLGTLVLGTAALALGEVVRPGRFLNLPLGLLIGGLSFLPGSTPATRINDICCGVVIAALSLPRGRVGEAYGTWKVF